MSKKRNRESHAAFAAVTGKDEIQRRREQRDQARLRTYSTFQSAAEAMKNVSLAKKAPKRKKRRDHHWYLEAACWAVAAMIIVLFTLGKGHANDYSTEYAMKKCPKGYYYTAGSVEPKCYH